MATPNSYRGFPYTVAVVTEAPSLTADQVAEFSRWQDLPRRRVVEQGQQSTLPTRPAPPRPPPPKPIAADYVDGEVTVTEPKMIVCNDGSDDDDDDDDTQRNSVIPTLYIDLPEVSSSNVSERVEPTPEASYVQETIFYDPFGDTMVTNASSTGKPVNENPDSSDSTPTNGPSYAGRPSYDSGSNDPGDLNYAAGSSDAGESSHAGSSSGPSGSRPYLRPMPSGQISGVDERTATLPPFLTKESQVYGSPNQPSSDGFNLSPLPVSDFREPPPSYDEVRRIDNDSRVGNHGNLEGSLGHSSNLGVGGSNVVVEQPRLQGEQPNRVQVITSTNQKIIFCNTCRQPVRAVRIQEIGPRTHLLAWAFMICCLFPITFTIYCFKCCRYKNHYCPQCSKRVAYEKPGCCCVESRLYYSDNIL